MTERIDLDQVRRTALDRIERTERNFKIAFFAVVIWEALFLIALLFAVDFSERIQVLLLIATVGSYSLVILGLVALGAHMSRNTQRILKALELRD